MPAAALADGDTAFAIPPGGPARERAPHPVALASLPPSFQRRPLVSPLATSVAQAAPREVCRLSVGYIEFRVLRMQPVTRHPSADTVCVGRELSRWHSDNGAAGMRHAVPADFGCEPPKPAAGPAGPDDKQIAFLACDLSQHLAGVPA